MSYPADFSALLRPGSSDVLHDARIIESRNGLGFWNRALTIESVQAVLLAANDEAANDEAANDEPTNDT